MPEIVEVRVVKDTLKKKIVKKKIKKIDILYPRIIHGNVQEFVSHMEGATFNSVESFGKYLIFDLGEYGFLSHLRMEGKYFYEPSDKELEKHTHVIFHLDDGYDLRYNDVRKFGRIELVKMKDLMENPSIKKLGIEPDDDKLDKEYLLKKLSKSRSPIKIDLLDQSIINGLGNIYANEVLFVSRINPERLSNTITDKEAEDIIKNAKKIVEKSYSMGGCTIRSYTSSLGVIGHYQECLNVQSREGKPCNVCGKQIKRIRQGGRSTFYCDNCQK